MLFCKVLTIFLVLCVNIQNGRTALYNSRYNDPEIFHLNSDVDQTVETNRNLVETIRKYVEFIRNAQNEMTESTRDVVKRGLRRVLNLINKNNDQGSLNPTDYTRTRSALRSLSMQQRYLAKMRNDLRAKSRFRRQNWESRARYSSDSDDNSGKEDSSQEDSDDSYEQKKRKKGKNKVKKQKKTKHTSYSGSDASDSSENKRFKVVKKGTKKKWKPKYRSDSEGPSVGSLSEEVTKKPKKVKENRGNKDVIYSQGAGRHIIGDFRKGNIREPYFLPKQRYFDKDDIRKLTRFWVGPVAL